MNTLEKLFTSWLTNNASESVYFSWNICLNSHAAQATRKIQRLQTLTRR